MNKTPRQRRKAKNRAGILDAATHLIVSKGFENLSLREIAKRADYSPAGLYKHFSSKSAIVQAVYARENQQLLDFLATVPADLSPRQRLVELCLRYVQFSLENRAFLTLVINLSTERRSKESPVPRNSPFLVIIEAVQAWVQDENITLTDDYGLEEISYALWSQTQGMATLRFNQLKAFEADFETVNRQTLEIFLTGLQQRRAS